ncbi:hypothetical protein ACFQS1_39145 [Paractinoplanes rhizophilus]|uniref:Uncharacterized protein n=1 Tax=Paractinoplanes rhizophilus TaxID=1416877 RepID=A0ABW2I578_9ACTN
MSQRSHILPAPVQISSDEALAIVVIPRSAPMEELPALQSIMSLSWPFMRYRCTVAPVSGWRDEVHPSGSARRADAATCMVALILHLMKDPFV